MKHGFYSPARGLIARRSRAGCVWCARVAQGNNSFPAALCVPFLSWSVAASFAGFLSREGARAFVRRAKRTRGPVEVKIIIPRGQRARDFLPGLGVGE